MSEKDILFSQDSLVPVERMFSELCSAGRFHLNNASLTHVPDNWRIESFRRNEDLHLLLVMGGEGWYYLGDNEVTVTLKKGTLIFVGSGMAHSSRAKQPSKLYIAPVRFGMYDKSGQSLTASLYPFAAVQENVDLNRYLPLFKRLNELKFNGLDNAVGRELADSVLRQILAEMIVGSRMQHDERVELVISLFEQEPLKRWTISELAGYCQITEKHLTRLFNRIIGMPPAAYQRKLRIDRARMLLEDTQMTIAEVSDALGYADQFTFSKQFKAVTGVSPGALRK